LKGEPVDEIEIDAAITEFARVLHHGVHQFLTLFPMHGVLDPRIEILNAKTQPVEAEFGERGQMFPRGDPGIGFDG